MAAISILKALELLAAREPDKAILIEDERVVTRAQFDASTNRLARAFAAHGVTQGDFVSIILPNSIAFLETVAAVWKLGAVPQPLPAKLAAKELTEIIALAKPKLIVGQPPTTPDNCAVIPHGFSPNPALSAAPLPDAVAPHFKAMVSGGSTGRPKIIVAGNPGMIDLEAPFPTVQPNERFLVTGPLYHNAPFLGAVMCLLSGGSVVMMSRFDAEDALRMIERHKVNFITLVPTMMHRIWRLGETVRRKYDMSSLRAMVHSAAPCPTWLKEGWIEWLGPDRVLEAYSNTEAPGYTYITGREWLSKKGSVGKAPPSTCQIKICDQHGHELPPGHVGEIFMRPTLGAGSTYCYGERYFYIGAEPRLLSDGWESMGDLGYIDPDGYLYLADRRSDIIIRGGANIFPAEIEAVIDSHPSVRSSVVFGLPDLDLGETVCAVVDADQMVDEVDLRHYLAHRLSPYKVPTTFEFVQTALRDDAGKVCRRKFRDKHLQTHGNLQRMQSMTAQL
ncbi:MAG: AMP-binding protein [Rhodospirillaceae bacterium]|nr:AMP-binding protein [Rhodospirillaceae bacterium]